MSRVVIVGAGFGGLGCAHTLANAVAKDAARSVVLVDAKDWFTIGGTWAYAWCGRVETSQTTWPLKDAAPRLPGVDLRLNTTVLSVDIEKRTVTLSDAPGSPVPYDALVLSPGIVGDASGIPGLGECVDMYAHDHLERQRRDIQRIAEEARRVVAEEKKARASDADDADDADDASPLAIPAEKRRTLAVTVAAVPYKCPVAPFEAAFVADAFFRDAGVREAVRIVVTAPVSWPLPDPARAIFEAYLAEKDVEFVPSVEIREVTRDSEASNFDVVFHDGSVLKNASAVWAVYPQTAPRFVKDAGLANAAGFVPADIGTNRVATDAGAARRPGACSASATARRSWLVATSRTRRLVSSRGRWARWSRTRSRRRRGTSTPDSARASPSAAAAPAFSSRRISRNASGTPRTARPKRRWRTSERTARRTKWRGSRSTSRGCSGTKRGRSRRAR